MMKSHIAAKYFSLFFALILISSITSRSIYALNFPAGKEDLYTQNNILFYEPGTETNTFGYEDCNKYLSASSFSGVAPSGNGPSNTNAQYIVSKLREAGYDNPAIAGIMGNLQGEDSKFDPNDVEYKTKYGGRIEPPTTGHILEWRGRNNVGYGIVQWTSEGRQQNLDNYAVKTGRLISDLDVQVEYLIIELKSYESSPNNLNNHTLEETTFQILKKYESPGAIIYSTHDGKYYNDYVPDSFSQIDETRTPAAYKTFTTRLGYAKAFYQSIETNYENVIVNQVNQPDTTAYEACLRRQSGNMYSINCTKNTKIWYGTKYPNLTDEDLYALLRVAIAENGEGEGLEKELSIIPNLNEIYNKSGSMGNLVNYVRSDNWFSTRDAIDDTGYTLYTDRYNKEKVERNLALADDIIRKGRRRIPPEIYEHDNITDIAYIKNNGVTYTDEATILNRSNYISGQTIIKANVSTDSDEYTFWQFARYDNNGKPDGDPFGYPLSKSLSQPNEDTCQSGNANVTPGTVIGATELSIEIPTTSLLSYKGTTLGRMKELFPNVNIPTKSSGSGVDYQKLWDAIPPSAVYEAGTYTYNPSTRDLNTKNAKKRTDSFFKSFEIEYYDKSSNTIKTRHITMHKSLEEVTKKAFHEVAIRQYETDGTTYGLSYRGMASDSSKLSNHSLGTAFDINTQDNPWHSWSCVTYKGISSQRGGDDDCFYYNTSNPKAVPIWVANIFIYYGFRWLGDHNGDEGRKFDPMHFSYTLN